MLKVLLRATAIAAAALFIAPQGALAAPFEITYNGIVPANGKPVDFVFNSVDGGAQAGEFSLTATNQGQDPSLRGNFLAWCFDLSGSVTPGGKYNYSTNSFLSSTALGRVLKVFDAGYHTLTNDQVTRAGFQVAIWEAIYDGLAATGLGTSQGAFYLRNVASGEKLDIKNKAANFLTLAQAPNLARKWNIIQLNAVNPKVQDLGLATPIPLPAAVWLLLGVSGALVVAKRRSAGKAA